eukprot:CAMPEP_0114995712 /NCGR_PEP_ID=MMETSP0216-20121206/13889_1 /TAXON_ID=223996 /ORGANISM="Protocruzia adherens, Strain Boccale" /LENGTH=202 /DNA_ID=CAMNT_0002359799 /DNA_START=58 /DNA_END=666 /DNA_ORIENTATION=+
MVEENEKVAKVRKFFSIPDYFECDEEVTDTSVLKPGDHVFCIYPTFSHHGVVSTPGRNAMEVKAIHFWEGVIQESDLDYFNPEAMPLYRRSYPHYLSITSSKGITYTPDTPDNILTRARGELDKENYSLVFNNCEHFTYFSITGKGTSPQVQNAVTLNALKLKNGPAPEEYKGVVGEAKEAGNKAASAIKGGFSSLKAKLGK